MDSNRVTLIWMFYMVLVIFLQEHGFFSLLRSKSDFREGERIPLFAHNVHPQNNSCKSYSYFDLPFCPPGDPIRKTKKSLGEVLTGDCLTNTQYELEFVVDTKGKALCWKNLTKDEVAKFRYAVRNKFEYDMYFDNILLRGNVGMVQENIKTPESSVRCYIFTHIRFDLFYSGKQVKHISASSDFKNAVDITEVDEINITFSYSVLWRELSDIQANFHPCLRHGLLVELWSRRPRVVLYLVVSVIMVVLVSVIYLDHGNYLDRYLHGVHGDGCRCPAYSCLLGPLIGIGTQKLITICTLLVLAYNDKLHRCNPGAMHTYVFLTYCLTSAVAGYVATFIHSKFSPIGGGKECIFLTGTLYLVPAFFTSFALNYLLRPLSAPSGLPGLQISDSGLVIWVLCAVILLCLGGTIAHYFRSEIPTYCATRRIQMPTAQQPWYLRTPVQMFLGGLLPFTVISREMDSIYASLWNHKVCGAFTTLLIAFLVVSIMTVLLGVVFTYYQLSIGDYNWYWLRYVLRGGSTAIFMFAYGIYFHIKTKDEVMFIEDEKKFWFFINYTAWLSYGFFLALGTVGFIASTIVFNYRKHKVEWKHE